MTDFNDPGTGGGDRFPIGDAVGSLLLFTVKEETQPIATVHGESTAMQADVAILDGPLKGETFTDALFFQRVLKGQLRGSVGAMVLGRLERGERKPGKEPPYQLAKATDADKEIGRKYLAYAAAQAVAVEEPF